MIEMEVKEAVALAKRHVAEVFAEESLKNVGLEEIEFEESKGVWCITLGFSRPWDEMLNVFSALKPENVKRSYKVIRIDDSTQKVLSIKNRENTNG
jgi:hypothetical protein